mmetsp:Transcript_45027/g.50940  ORF Transcript_45027/g.50940 Transcript_45027/m.50940 type:complete len:194 (+) Transcript_45027:695-1276(+)
MIYPILLFRLHLLPFFFVYVQKIKLKQFEGPYCQKVWITLEEKKIPYKIEKVNMRCYGDKPRSFLNMQPNGNIPVAIIDGTVYSSSNEILAALERLFPNHKSLQPEDGKRARELLQLEGQLGSAWLSWLGSSANQESRFENVLKRVDNALSESEGSFFRQRNVDGGYTVYILFGTCVCFLVVLQRFQNPSSEG